MKRIIIAALLIASVDVNASNNTGAYKKCMKDMECATLYKSQVRRGDKSPFMTSTKRCKQSRDCRKIAEAIVYEARSEPFAGGVLVAQVILNRKVDKRYGSTVYSVVHKPGAFSYVRDMRRQKRPTVQDHVIAEFIAWYAMQGKWRNRWGNVKPTHYWRYDAKSERRYRNSKKMQYLGRIGNHKVYREVSEG